MTDLHSCCHAALTQVLREVSDSTAKADIAVQQASATLASTPDAEPRTIEQLLGDVLRNARHDLSVASANRDKVKASGYWKRFWHLEDAEKEVGKANAALAEKEKFERQEAAVSAREANSNERAAMRAAHDACRKALGAAKVNLERHVQAQSFLEQLCEPLRDALIRRAWIAGDTKELLDKSVGFAQKQDWEAAAKAIQEIKFQRLPSGAQFRQWMHEYRDKLKAMRDQSAGLVATAAYPGLRDPSLQLAKSRFCASTWADRVECYEDLSDRWYAVPVRMTSPGALIEPVQWIIYWAFLVQSQRFANSTGSVKVHEDSLTGMLTYALKGELEAPAKDRLRQLGYPEAKANLDLLQLAGTNGEFETGADIGVVIHLDVGDLQVHKVALLQAKVSKGESAEIGSKPSGSAQLTQLQKLRDAKRDFFLFYHKTMGLSPALLPTVTAVNHYAKQHKWKGADLKKENKTVKTRLHGWDLASFAAFGLCSPGNGVGRDVPDGGDPLEAMIANGRSSLPTYMMVVSLSHDESIFENAITSLYENGYRTAPGPESESDLRRSPDDHHYPGA